MKRPPPARFPFHAILMTMLAVGWPAAAEGAPRSTAGEACASAPGDAVATVASVDDALDVTLADGRRLRLVGLAPARATAASPDLPVRAGRALSAWAMAGPTVVHTLAPAPDRWGRWPAALVHADAADGEARAADAMLRAGLARARPEVAVHACFDALLAAEAEARAARRGLWADPRYAILHPADTEGLAAQAGDMVLAEGVVHIHDGRGTLYLGLSGDRWGLTAILPRRDVQRFAKAGLDLRDYDGTPVRLRGDLDMRFGPRLRLAEPDAVESLEPGSLIDGTGPPKHWTDGEGNR